jgi:hypothetical protein
MKNAIRYSFIGGFLELIINNKFFSSSNGFRERNVAFLYFSLLSAEINIHNSLEYGAITYNNSSLLSRQRKAGRTYLRP